MTATVDFGPVLGIALAMVRLLGLFLVAPIFSHPSLPLRVRVGLAFAIAVAGVGALPEAPVLEGPLPWLVVREATLGVGLGMATSLVFHGFALLGELASIQGGLGAAAVLDPTSGSQSVVLTSLVQIFGILAFLAIDGHHLLLRTLALSFEAFPVGAAALPVAGFGALAALGGLVFEVAVRLAAPVTAVMFVANVGVGMLGRAIPQLNLMALQLPAHVAITLLILGLAAGPLMDVMAETARDATDQAARAVLGVG